MEGKEKLDKEINKLGEQMKETADNLSNFVNTFMDDFSDEEKEKINEEMKKQDLSGFKKEVSSLMNKLNKEFAKMNK